MTGRDADGPMDVLGRQAMANRPIGRTEARALVEANGGQLLELFHWAGRVRRAYFGNQVKFCSIAAGKVGACAEDCHWCAQSARYHTHIPAGQARATAESIRQAAQQAARDGASCFGVVNSGRRPTEADLPLLASAAEAIPPGVMVGASVGELDDRTAERLFAMGVRRYNHNLETSRRHFTQVVTTHAYDDRLRTLAAARRAGMSLCCGGIFGLGETWDDRLDLALTLRDEVRPDSVPLNFLHPIPGTPLAGVQPLTPMECLHIIAVFRLLLPTCDLKIAGGRQVNLRGLQSWMYHVGATSCLVGNYLTTPGCDVEDDRRMVADLGLQLVAEFTRPPAAADES